jgi:hypothetical protein
MEKMEMNIALIRAWKVNTYTLMMESPRALATKTIVYALMIALHLTVIQNLPVCTVTMMIGHHALLDTSFTIGMVPRTVSITVKL